ncbi:hypothetical protein C8R47DRAFT_1129906 [Mycena vitilis]|nr:hypothetical protein C8R47DRAFT_1129906 [Mycena vitilis]
MPLLPVATSVTIELHRTGLSQLSSVLPFDTSNLCRALEPLPSWCATGPYPFVSQRALPLLGELYQAVPTSPSVGVHRKGSFPCLNDIFNLTLSTVVDIRSLCNCNESPHSALPFVLGLIRVLARICVADAAVLADVPFARPRVAPSQCGLDTLHGVAIMLACHVVEGCAKEPIPGPAFSSRASTKPKSSLFYSLDEDSECDGSNADIQSLDVPLEAHILPGSGKMHERAHLPFLCVADSANIIDLMASVACQRYVWGFDEPAVGFAMSAGGLRASLVLSWVDPTTNIVHVAHTVSDLKGGISGIFDFTDAASTLAFAHFVLDFSSTFCTTTSCKSRNFNWRSDMAAILSRNFSDSRDRVEQWVRDVKASSSEADNISRARVENGTKMQGNSPPYPRDGEEAVNSARDSADYPTEPPSHMLHRGHERDYHPWPWAFDRRVQFLAACTSLELPNTMKESPRAEVLEINRMVQVYDRMCEFRWCVTWESNRPPVDAALLGARDRMIGLAIQARRSLTADRPSLEPHHRHFLEHHMPAVLLPPVSLTPPKKISRTHTASRYDWDRFLYLFYLQPDERISSCVLHEPTVYLARNELADKFSEESTYTYTVKEHIDATITLAFNSLNAASEESYQEEADVVDDTIAFELQFQEELECENGPQCYQSLVRNRSHEEPLIAGCDAILLADPILVPSELVADLEFLLQRQHPSVETHGPNNDSQGSPPLTLPPPAASSLQAPLRIPHAVVHYNTSAQSVKAAIHGAHMTLVSVVAFHSALGIDDHPFYSLVTTDTSCLAFMAWKSSSQQKIYLIDRNIREFDLASPMEALQFAAFLLRLRDDREALSVRVARRLEEGIDYERLQRWKKIAQAHLHG